MAATKESHRLSALEVAHIGPVLEDCMEQLAIMGYLMPHGANQVPTAVSTGSKARKSSLPDAEVTTIYMHMNDVKILQIPGITVVT